MNLSLWDTDNKELINLYDNVGSLYSEMGYFKEAE